MTTAQSSTGRTASDSTLPGVLRTAAARFGERLAVVDADAHLSFARLLELVRETARGYADLGLERGERVALWAPNSWRWEVAALAVSYAGGTLVPLNTRYTGHEVVEVLSRVDARLVVVADGFLDRSQVGELESAAAEAGVALPMVVRLSATSDTVMVQPEERSSTVNSTVDVEVRADAVSPDDVADILFTSGTTGRSKGACSAHRQTVSVARTWADLGEVSEADRYLVVNPFFHSFGYKAGIVVSLVTGATIVPMPVFDATRMMQLVEEHQITVLPGAPAIYQALLEAPDRSEHDLSSLRFAVTGAAVVPVALVERMQSELSFDLVLTAFGMTECVVGTMCRRGDPPELVAGTCGRAVPGLEVRVAEPGTNTPLATGEEGEVLFRGDTVMLGYLDDPEATAETVDADGWLHSGDIGRLDEDGYLKITDRLKDVFFVGGFNVYPAEVEQVLARLDGVVESAVVGVPDERLGEVGKAFVVRRAGAQLDDDAVVTYLKERVANFKVPREVEFVDSLPRNLAGKILKRTLRQGQEPAS
jgi:acyl-CoA synthetase (AMP-forming)/AMP-acid ligase II